MKTSDLELIKDAAKAAGLPILSVEETHLNIRSEGSKSGYRWNPLYDDGDAFTLLVRLELTFDFEAGLATVTNPTGKIFHFSASDTTRGDRSEAARRAITEAAAAFGKEYGSYYISLP